MKSGQVKKLVERTVVENTTALSTLETERDTVLKDIGNLVHDSVVVSQDEVSILILAEC